MEAGAMGAEIIISGKLRTERARSEKFRDGYLPKSGEPAIKYVRTAVTHVQLKPGIFGVKVSIMPPNVKLPDQIEFLEEEVEEISEEPVEETVSSSEPSREESERPVTEESSSEKENIQAVEEDEGERIDADSEG